MSERITNIEREITLEGEQAEPRQAPSATGISIPREMAVGAIVFAVVLLIVAVVF